MLYTFYAARFVRRGLVSTTTGPYARRASGLVRQVTLFDAFSSNLAAMPPYAIVLLPLWLISITPGSDLLLSIVLFAIGAMVAGTCWTFLTVSMPRSGGDYVFNSRITNPLVGFFTNASVVVAQFNWTAWNVWLLTQSLTMMTYGYAALTNNPGISSMLPLFSQPAFALALGSVIVWIICGLLIIGTKAFFMVVNALVVIASIMMFVVVGILLANVGTNFPAEFNQFMLPLTQNSNYYQFIIQTAQTNGFTAGSYGSNMWSTLEGMAVVSFALYWFYWTAYLGGEIKGANSVKRMLTTNLTSCVYLGVPLAVAAILSVQIFGYSFLGSLAFLGYVPGSTVFPTFVWEDFLIMILTKNALLSILIEAGIIASMLMTGMIAILMVTRCMLAWSFDRLIPTWFGHIHERYHSPVRITILSAIITEAFLVVFNYSTWLSAYGLSAVLQSLLSVAVVCLSCILFPSRLKTMYEASPIAKYKIGRAPLVTILGVIAFLFNLFLFYALVVNPAFGANTQPGLIVVFGTSGAAIVWYILAHFYHKSRGINLSLVFREVPAG